MQPANQPVNRSSTSDADRRAIESDADRRAIEDGVEHSEHNARSSYGAVPGEEFPASVYVSVFVAFAWILAASLIAFARDADANLAIGMAVVLMVVFFALPVLVWLTARSHARSSPATAGNFLTSRVETATGTLTGANAWLQIAVIPTALALAATLIGAASLLVH